ncbi:MAG: cobalt-precorrin-5B (C(1))-methyltransferase CbiD, partial [Muribaculaceae bacterium]|nr:cobalt-precorrin-5B (C(1))-methyltransferase CbiD [Muribaculaceae bacterium]
VRSSAGSVVYKRQVAYASHAGIKFYGGEGIGTVTLPGLGLEIGEPAINPAPRTNIIDELSPLYSRGLDVTISLENGKELAEKTFNPRVGVVGGVSIIGTTGIIRPFSHEAFIDCIRRGMDVAIAMSCERVVVNSGGKSERFMKTLYPSLPPHAFIHYGNSIGETMEIGKEKNVARMTIGIMLGKAVKLAEGNMDTHSHKITVNREFLKRLAKDAGCSDEALTVIDSFNLARELPSLLSVADASCFFPALLKRCHQQCSEIFSNILDAVLLSDDGKILSRIES